MLSPTLGRYVRVLRKGQGLTQVELVERLRDRGIPVTQPLLSKLERDAPRDWGFGLICGIADELNVNLDDLRQIASM